MSSNLTVPLVAGGGGAHGSSPAAGRLVRVTSPTVVKHALHIHTAVPIQTKLPLKLYVQHRSTFNYTNPKLFYNPTYNLQTV